MATNDDYPDDEIPLSSALIQIAILIFACFMTYVTFITLYDSPLGVIILVGIALVGAGMFYFLLKKTELLNGLR